MKDWVAKTRRPEVLGGLGGFAGLFDASRLARLDHPVLATSTDGVGTKVAIAQAMDVHDTIGFDLVGMVVDDLVVCGAEPLFMTDYIACGRVVPGADRRDRQGHRGGVRRGRAARCSAARRPSTPGCSSPDEYDIAGAATGVVERDKILGPDRVETRRRGAGHGIVRPALQRLLAGQARVEDRRLVARPGGAGARPDASARNC